MSHKSAFGKEGSCVKVENIGACIDMMLEDSRPLIREAINLGIEI